MARKFTEGYHLDPKKKYKDSYDGRVQTGSEWLKEFAEIVEYDRTDWGIFTTTVEEYEELYTMNNGEYDHALTEV